MKVKSKKKKTLRILAFAGCFALCCAAGYFLGMVIGSDGDLVTLAAAVVFMVLAYFIHIPVHEAGHLVFGLLTGYSFVSYRVGSLMLVKTGEGLKFRRMGLAGTGGQCLMDPPELIDGRMPCFLYNMGGAIMNLLAAMLCLALSFVCGGLVRTFFRVVMYIGVFVALNNGIPIRMGGVDNDGKNALSLGKDPIAMRALWVQLRINAMQCRGIRLKDMPGELFELPPEEGMTNPLVASQAVFAANRLLDFGQLDAAGALMERLLEVESLPEIYKGLMRCDLATCALIGGNLEKAEAFLEGSGQRRFMRSMKKYISVIRTNYAIARLAEPDAEKSAALMARFEKAAARHPSTADVESEREMIARINAAFAEDRDAISET